MPCLRLNEARQKRRLLERHFARALVEIESRCRLDTVGAVSEVNMVAVQGQNLALREALLDLDGHDGFLDLALPALFEANVTREQVPRELLGEGARPGQASPHRITNEGDQDARDAQAEVAVELRVLRRDDRLAQLGGDVVIADDQPPLDRELPDDFSPRRIDAGDGARRVIVQRGNLREIAGIREHHAAEDAEEGRREEQRGQSRVPGDPDDVVCAAHQPEARDRYRACGMPKYITCARK